MTPVKRILEESEGVKKVTFDPKTETFLVEVSKDFQVDEVAKRILQAGKEHNKRPGQEGRADWVIKVVKEGNLESKKSMKSTR